MKVSIMTMRFSCNSLVGIVKLRLKVFHFIGAVFLVSTDSNLRLKGGKSLVIFNVSSGMQSSDCLLTGSFACCFLEPGLDQFGNCA